jgi:hypothetical protein
MQAIDNMVWDEIYQRVFQQDGDGAAILEQLAAKYHHGTSHVPGDPYETAFNEGARSVVLYIMGRTGENLLRR